MLVSSYFPELHRAWQTNLSSPHTYHHRFLQLKGLGVTSKAMCAPCRSLPSPRGVSEQLRCREPSQTCKPHTHDYALGLPHLGKPVREVSSGTRKDTAPAGRFFCDLCSPWPLLPICGLVFFFPTKLAHCLSYLHKPRTRITCNYGDRRCWRTVAGVASSLIQSLLGQHF